MDSVTQAALGAAVAVGVMHRRTAVWKAARWGAVAGPLPDLDVFVDHGDPILDMVLHRAQTHSLFWLTLLSAPLAGLVAWLHGQQDLWKRWWLALWLVLITHPLLDTMTVYGTQLLLPFTHHPYGVGSLFIIDPRYTVPLLVGAVLALAWRKQGLTANLACLVLSTAYMGWSVVAQHQVQQIARTATQAQGFYALRDDQGLIRITDLRRGQHPTFTPAFHAVESPGDPVALVPARAVGTRPDPAVDLPWLWRRIWGERIPSPS